MSIYEQYISYHQQYTAIYGNKTIVLCQIGSFFEMESVDTENIREGPNLSEICSILNIQMTRKNKSIPECSRSNPYLAGIPCVSLKKYTDIEYGLCSIIQLLVNCLAMKNPAVISKFIEIDGIRRVWVLQEFVTDYPGSTYRNTLFKLLCSIASDPERLSLLQADPAIFTFINPF